MNEQLAEMLGLMHQEELLREVDTWRRLRTAGEIPARRGNPAARLLIRVGRGLERLGERLAGGQLGDAAVGGAR